MKPRMRCPFWICRMCFIEVGDHREGSIAGSHERKENAGDEDAVDAHGFPPRFDRQWYQVSCAGESQKGSVDKACRRLPPGVNFPIFRVAGTQDYAPVSRPDGTDRKSVAQVKRVDIR